ncbi:hypothetical protein GBAR_LOCUS1321, partial [Geodia barretti]
DLTPIILLVCAVALRYWLGHWWRYCAQQIFHKRGMTRPGKLVVEEERDNGVTRWPTTLAGTPATILTRLEEAEPAGEDITRE